MPLAFTQEDFLVIFIASHIEVHKVQATTLIKRLQNNLQYECRRTLLCNFFVTIDKPKRRKVLFFYMPSHSVMLCQHGWNDHLDIRYMVIWQLILPETTQRFALYLTYANLRHGSVILNNFMTWAFLKTLRSPIREDLSVHTTTWEYISVLIWNSRPLWDDLNRITFFTKYIHVSHLSLGLRSDLQLCSDQYIPSSAQTNFLHSEQLLPSDRGLPSLIIVLYNYFIIKGLS